MYKVVLRPGEHPGGRDHAVKWETQSAQPQWQSGKAPWRTEDEIAFQDLKTEQELVNEEEKGNGNQTE